VDATAVNAQLAVTRRKASQMLGNGWEDVDPVRGC
jgi:hypothetical protein